MPSGPVVTLVASPTASAPSASPGVPAGAGGRQLGMGSTTSVEWRGSAPGESSRMS